MITLGVIDARIKRQKISDQAGAQFVPREEVKSRISALRGHKDSKFLFGIFEDNDKWTALSVESLIGCYNGKLSELNLRTEADLFHGFFGQDGGKHKSDVLLNDGRKFWMKSVGISCSFQNIILMLQKLPQDITLDE
ncbi:MAG: hypothetical protein ABJH45_08235 [Paracoccaceae bacterium]